MNECAVCRWSFAVDLPEGENGPQRPVRKCWPYGQQDKEKLATELCGAFRPIFRGVSIPEGE